MSVHVKFHLFSERHHYFISFFNPGYDPFIHCVLLTFLIQEIERFDKLLCVVHKSLKDLQLAVKGEIILNQELEEIYHSFLSTRVPALWQVSNDSLLFTSLIEIKVLVSGEGGKLPMVYPPDDMLRSR